MVGTGPRNRMLLRTPRRQKQIFFGSCSNCMLFRFRNFTMLQKQTKVFTQTDKSVHSNRQSIGNKTGLQTWSP